MVLVNRYLSLKVTGEVKMKMLFDTPVLCHISCLFVTSSCLKAKAFALREALSKDVLFPNYSLFLDIPDCRAY